MNPQLEHLKKLTLAAEAAVTENDMPTLKALLEEREREIARLPASSFHGDKETLEINARLLAASSRRMDGLRERMRQVAHISRTARAARAAQASLSKVDVTG